MIDLLLLSEEIYWLIIRSYHLSQKAFNFTLKHHFQYQ